MGEVSSEVYTCYCEAEILSEELESHFNICPRRNNSQLYQLITKLLTDLLTAPKYTYFLEKEMMWELKRVQAQRTKSGRKRVIKKCGVCGTSEMTQGKSLPCNHSFCKEHVPAGPCPKCHETPVPVTPLPVCQQCTESSGPLITLEYCSHTFCHSHIRDAFPLTFAKTGEMNCFVCNHPMLQPEVKKVMGEQIVDNALLALALPEGYNLVCCPKCGNGGVLEPGEIDYRVKDGKGRLYSRAAAEDYSKYRFSCPSSECRTSTCANCGASPYHEALTCDQYSRLQHGTCRYCEEFPPVAEDCCETQQCQEMLRGSCRKVQPCGHRCFGTAGEFSCPPCLVDKCTPALKVSEQEYCSICGTEKLRNGPVVELECGHFLHYRCLKDTLWKRWPGTRITFKFCKCPLCSEWAVPKANEELQREIGKYQGLFEDIKNRGLERLRREPEENTRINDPQDRTYFNQPERYVMDRFCFYECFRDRKIYFGGKKECEDNSEQMQNPNELLCPDCIAVAPGAKPGSKNCPAHGIDFIEYKCRYCCSVASFFCWGTTHFCESCHKRHNDGEHLNKKTPDQFPQCPGALRCPLRVAHPPNGQEFVLGCSLCRKGEA